MTTKEDTGTKRLETILEAMEVDWSEPCHNINHLLYGIMAFAITKQDHNLKFASLEAIEKLNCTGK